MEQRYNFMFRTKHISLINVKTEKLFLILEIPILSHFQEYVNNAARNLSGNSKFSLNTNHKILTNTCIPNKYRSVQSSSLANTKEH